MEFSPKQQIIELIKSSRRILLATHQNPDGDAIGSLLGFYLALAKLGKEVVIASPEPPAEFYKFLPQSEKISQKIEGSPDFVIALNTAKAQVERLGYKQAPDKGQIQIIVTPSQGGYFSPEDVSFVPNGGAKFDLILVLDTPDLDRLGALYDQNTELFYGCPVVNIDHHPSNSHFGKVNLVEITATSTCEILLSLIEALGVTLNDDIATSLLTGIIADTNSFQNLNTTPKSLTVAAQLIAAGARQTEIIQHLYKTKPLSTLKLWGEILSRVVLETEHRFVWSEARTEDFTKTGAKEEESSGVIDELLKAASQVDFALLLFERGGGVHGSLRSAQKGVNVSEVATLFGGGGHETAAAFHLENVTLGEKREEILGKLREYQTRSASPLDSARGGPFVAPPEKETKW